MLTKPMLPRASRRAVGGGAAAALLAFALAASGLAGRGQETVLPAPAERARHPLPHIDPEIGWFFRATLPDTRQSDEALHWIADLWKDGYTPIIVDLARFMRPARRRPDLGEDAPSPRGRDEEPESRRRMGTQATETPPGPGDPTSKVRERLIQFLERRTGRHFGDDLNQWREWMWNLPYDPHPDYAAFKSALYGRVDPRMAAFFRPDARATIRLDEIDWGGVHVNEIPPLDHSATIPAAEAGYLKDGHIVFGVEVNGEARAYPRRILAWHEIVRDTIGGVDLAVVYCTLCGTVVPYEPVAAGRKVTLGASGLLYQSNKLLFDEESLSLWSSLEGAPVVGPLAGIGVRLRFRPVVTTTWQEWRTLHPETTVLSLETGFMRDYSEGGLLRRYWADDRLMFRVSRADTRLKNKAEVLVLRPPADRRPPSRWPGSTASGDRPIAISVEFLRRNPVYHLSMGDRSLVVVTSTEGANRVYDAGTVRFTRAAGVAAVGDAGGGIWRVTEEALVADRDPARQLPRIPAHRAYWFGWYAQFPDTELIK